MAHPLPINTETQLWINDQTQVDVTVVDYAIDTNGVCHYHLQGQLSNNRTDVATVQFEDVIESLVVDTDKV